MTPFNHAFKSIHLEIKSEIVCIRWNLLISLTNPTLQSITVSPYEARVLLLVTNPSIIQIREGPNLQVA
jgi:hypothetical protein